jgi:queuosine precursor transporter
LKSILQNKKTNLFIILSCIFLTNAIIAEVIGVKIFSLEGLLGIDAANIKLLDNLVLDFNLTAGVLIWPVVFITTDIINEYFGTEGVKKISYLSAIFISYIFLIIWIATLLPPAQFWLDIHKIDAQGNSFNIDYSFSKIFTQGLGIMFGSIVAFLLGQLLDANVFQFIKKLTGSKKIWLRATASTLLSQMVDSFVVLFIAFYLFGGANKWSFNQVISVAIINYIYKCSVAVLLIPVLYFGHSLIDKYLGQKESERTIEEASHH